MTQSAFAIALSMIPIFGVLYWFGAQHDTWQIVLAVHLVILVGCALVLWRQSRVFSAVTETHVSGRGIFSPMVNVPLEQIASVTIVPIYVGQAPEPTEQLLIRDAAGHRLFRMRANYWNPGDLNAVASALPVKPTVVTDAISSKEFFHQYTGSAYWFENRPIIAVLVVAGFALIAITITVLVMSVLGMKVGFLP
jgi:hypothetical protein